MITGGGRAGSDIVYELLLHFAQAVFIGSGVGVESLLCCSEAYIIFLLYKYWS